MLIWLSLAVVTAVTLLPLAWRVLRSPRAVGRRDAALSLHATQLGELDRDLRDGLIGPEDHATARLEIQRRMLAEAGTAETVTARARTGPLLAVLIIVPAAAVALYLVGGHPGMVAQPLAARIAASRASLDHDQGLLDQLRASLATADPHAERTRQGYLLVGQAEAQRGHWREAAAAWNSALAIRDDATVAFEAAEATTRADGFVSTAAMTQFRHAVDTAPGDAQWRMLAEQRIAEGEHQGK
jgi:cytochrome c-type biogenesis protein CcmH